MTPGWDAVPLAMQGTVQKCLQRSSAEALSFILPAPPKNKKSLPGPSYLRWVCCSSARPLTEHQREQRAAPVPGEPPPGAVLAPAVRGEACQHRASAERSWQ